MGGSIVAWSTTLGLLAVSRPVRAETPDASADAAFVVLRAGVDRDAGTIREIAADGAAGQCTVAAESVQCPARGAVTFRWAGDAAFVLTDGRSEGTITLDPGTTAEAWVLPPEAARVAERARLAPSVVTPADVHDLFFRTGDHPIAAPSYGMLEDLVALADHPDPLVRRELPDALLPWWRHTASDPLPRGAPSVLPDGLVLRLAHDPDPIVERRLASRLRDLREPGEDSAREATEALLWLARRGGATQRAALASLASRAREGETDGALTWRTALERLPTPGGPGRAAAAALTALAGEVEPGPEVDPVEAVRICLASHPERTWSLWNAWREEVPFDPSTAERLVGDTLGWSPSLLRYWARTAPRGLEDLLVRWEPSAPHSDRWLAMVRALGPVDDPGLAALQPLADNLSPGPSAAPAP